jgi:hypothetical protein
MGALIFYTAIFFIGYYVAHMLNQIAGRTLIQNRRLAGLVLVLMVSLFHGYKIITTAPPHDHGDGVGYALGLYVLLPVTIIIIAVLYLTWQDRQEREEQGKDGQDERGGKKS